MDRHQIKLSARGSSPTMVKVGQNHIKSWLIVLPPKNEQREIRDRLNKQLNRILITIEHIEQQITKLNELKSVIISESVTGKIKI